MTQEWPHMNSKQLEKSLNAIHRELFDSIILKNDCIRSNEKQHLPQIEQTIRGYQKLIQEYEAGIITLKDREVFLA